MKPEKLTKPLPEAKIFLDPYGIPCVECPRCADWIPNVRPAVITCPHCGVKFKAVEK